MAIMLTGCGLDSETVVNLLQENLGISPTSSPTPTITNTPTPSPTPIIPTYQPNTNYKSELEKEAANRVDSAITVAWENVLRVPVNESYKASEFVGKEKSAYERLSRDSLREFYDKVYNIAQNFEEFTYYEKDCKETDLSGFSFYMTAIDALYEDHPETSLYFDFDPVKREIITCYTLPGEGSKSRTQDYEEIKRRLELFGLETKRIVDNMPKGISDYDKYRYLAIVVCELNEYDYEYKTVGFPYQSYNAIVNGSSVCAGYSNAFYHLCKAANLYCEDVSGKGRNEAHAWNRVMLDGMTYNVDLTWADNDGHYSGFKFSRYFIVDETDFGEDHVANDGSVASGVPIKELADYFY